VKLHILAAIAGAALVTAVAGPSLAQTPAYITAAINDPTRPDADKKS
jgi:predicted methyltransferase